MAEAARKPEAMARGARMLRTALGPAIAGFLEDPTIVEVMLNPDGRLWIDRLSEGLSDTGATMSPADGERIVRLVLTALQLMLLTNPEYAELRARVETKIEDADQRLAELHNEAEAQRARCLAYLRSLEIRAGQLPDGTKVFRGENDDIFTADGEMLDAEQRELVTWRADSPSYEEYHTAAYAHQRAVEYADAITRAQNRVDEARDTLLNDQDNPTTSKALQDIEWDIGHDLQQIEMMRAQAAATTMSPTELTASFNASSPDLDIAGISPKDSQSVSTAPH